MWIMASFFFFLFTCNSQRKLEDENNTLQYKMPEIYALSMIPSKTTSQIERSQDEMKPRKRSPGTSGVPSTSTTEIYLIHTLWQI